MALAGPSYSGDSVGMPRYREPVMDGSADLAALHRRLAGTGVTGD
jgi:hypothetical protein